MTKNAFTNAQEAKARPRRLAVIRMVDDEGLTFRQVAERLGDVTPLRAKQIYQLGLYRENQYREVQAKADQWKDIAASLADELHASHVAAQHPSANRQISHEA